LDVSYGGIMNIRTMQILSRTTGQSMILKFQPGSSGVPMTYAFKPEDTSVEFIAKAFAFCFQGKRDAAIEEVSCEISDPSGDIWTIHRGPHGAKFMRGMRPIPVDEAQRSMLSSWLDMEIGLTAMDGLISPLTIKSVVRTETGVAAFDGINARPDNAGPNLGDIQKVLADECFKVTSLPQYTDVAKLASIVETLSEVHGRYQEVNQTHDGRTGEVAPGIVMMETLQKELDHLLQIEFLCRKMSDLKESVPRLQSLLEATQVDYATIKSRWSDAALTVADGTNQWIAGMDLLVKLKGYERLRDVALHIQGFISQKLTPASTSTLDAWQKFLGGTKEQGLETESCLASTILGLKQLSMDMDRYRSQFDAYDSTKVEDSAGGWLDRFKKAKAVSTGHASPSSIAHHKDWIGRSAHQLEAVKESVSFALKRVQELSEVIDGGHKITEQQRKGIDEIAVRAQNEVTRLNQGWVEFAERHGLPHDLALESYCSLLIEGAQFRSLAYKRRDLEERLKERRDIQSSLEQLVRQWWQIIGSDRKVDISNPAFLVAEAKAAMRYRESRRQRIQKAFKDGAKIARDEAIRQFAHRRRQEIVVLWKETFDRVGLPLIEITDKCIPQLLRLGGAAQSMLGFVKLCEGSLDLNGRSLFQGTETPLTVVCHYDSNLQSLPPADDLVAAHICRDLPDTRSSVVVIISQSEQQVDYLKGHGFGSIVTNTLKNDGDVGKRTAALPTSQKATIQRGATATETSDAQKNALLGAAPLAADSKKSSGNKNPKRVMSDRAAEALKILNPRGTTKNS
jgi:hypothetical protein